MKYIIFNDWLEKRYIWGSEKQKSILYNNNFITFIHDPPCYNITNKNVNNYVNNKRNKVLLETNERFLEDKDKLRILISLSDYHKNYIENNINLHKNTMVKKLFHPLELSNKSQMFDLDLFINNNNKRLYILGWWLRKYDVFLKIKYEKSLLIKSKEGPYVAQYIINRIRDIIGSKEDNNDSSLSGNELHILKNNYNVNILNFLENNEYDKIFSSNIIFIDTYDAVCNNVVLECIMNNTPLLINSNNMSSIEYLGIDYPFYFTNSEDAQNKLDNIELITKTHNYLKNMDKTPFTYNKFNMDLNNILYECV
jgi:hypothetical protein